MDLAPATAAQSGVPERITHNHFVDDSYAAPTAAEQGGGGFDGVLSALNPLQYVPVVGTIYRAITGDRPEPGWRLGGAAVTGFLMGGPVGVVGSMIGVCVEELFQRVVDAASGAAPPDGRAPDAATRGTAFAAYRNALVLEPAAGGVG
jgi:hypothetical protein